MTDRGLQHLEECLVRLTTLGQKQEDDMFDYKAGIISFDELQKRQIRTGLEKDSIILKEIVPLESAGYHHQAMCVKLPDGSLFKIGDRYYADGKPAFED